MTNIPKFTTGHIIDCDVTEKPIENLTIAQLTSELERTKHNLNTVLQVFHTVMPCNCRITKAEIKHDLSIKRYINIISLHIKAERE